MATGTGKTFTAFEIIWRLWKSKQKKRILFLADRNILVDQTKNNDFKPFGEPVYSDSLKQGAEPDPFDIICHIVYDQPSLSRKERAKQVRKNNYFSKYEGPSKQDWEMFYDDYKSPIPKPLRWRNWAADPEGMTGQELHRQHPDPGPSEPGTGR